MSTNDFMANVAIEINSSRSEVWDALINPSAIKQYMFGAKVVTLLGRANSKAKRMKIRASFCRWKLKKC